MNDTTAREPGTILKEQGEHRYVLLSETYGDEYVHLLQQVVVFTGQSVVFLQVDETGYKAIELLDETFATLLEAAANYQGHMDEIAEPTHLESSTPRVLYEHPFGEEDSQATQYLDSPLNEDEDEQEQDTTGDHPF